MTLFIRQTARGRCPCGAEHAACGPPSTVTPVDLIEEVAAVGGPLKKYRYINEAGHQTVLKLNEDDAKRHGLGDADLVDAPAPEAETKARPPAQNKARTARNKGGAGGGD